MASTEITDLLATAREHFRENDYRVAESLLEQILLADTRNPEVYHMLGTIYYDQGKFNKAIKTFRRALEIDPGFTDASVGLSIILNDLGRYEEGKRVFQDAQAVLKKRSRDADPYFMEKVALKHDELGELYFQHKYFNEALGQYTSALKLSSRHAELRMKIAECHIQLGNQETALKELRGLTSEYPQFIPAKIKLGVVLFNLGSAQEALECWHQVLLRDPDHPTAKRYIQMAQQAALAAKQVATQPPSRTF